MISKFMKDVMQHTFNCPPPIWEHNKPMLISQLKELADITPTDEDMEITFMNIKYTLSHTEQLVAKQFCKMLEETVE